MKQTSVEGGDQGRILIPGENDNDCIHHVALSIIASFDIYMRIMERPYFVVKRLLVRLVLTAVIVMDCSGLKNVMNFDGAVWIC